MSNQEVITIPKTAEAKHLDFTLNYYRGSPKAAQNIRSGYSDASHMCDAIAADIIKENTKNGRVSRNGAAMAAAVRRAGDAIWTMRAKVAP